MARISLFSNQNILLPESKDSRNQYFNLRVSWLPSVNGLLSHEGISGNFSSLWSGQASLLAPYTSAAHCLAHFLLDRAPFL